MATREGVYLAGDFYLLCEVCGFKRRRSEALERWDGAIVCAPHVRGGCYEEEHPLDRIQIPNEEQNVLDARYAAPTFVDDGSWVERDWVEVEFVI